MMSCQICGDQNGPWEYEMYKSANGKPWLIDDGTTILVCEDCAKVLRKRMKQEKKQELITKINKKHQTQFTYKGDIE